MAQLYAGPPVTGLNFVGREKEIEYITELLRLGQNIVLIAPRRYGKTSLVLEVLSRMKNPEIYSAYIDVFSIPTLEMLPVQITREVLKNDRLDSIFATTKNSALAMLKNLNLKATIEDFEYILGFSETQKNSWELLEKSIDFIDQFPAKHQKRMICTFDEFGDISKLDGDKIIKLFRSKIQLHKNASYIFSGSYESAMSSLFIEKNSPFFRFARVINLGNIEKEKFVEFFQTQLKNYQIECQNEYLTEILDFTKGHPYYSQLALQEIVIFNALNKRNPDFIELLEQLLVVEKNYIEKSWEEISVSKENVRLIMSVVQMNRKVYSDLKNSGINVSRAIKSLTQNGTISKTESGYELTDPLLSYWIETNVMKNI